VSVPRRRLLVTGSRSWDDVLFIERVLKVMHDYDPEALMVSGNCPKGVDLICETAWEGFGGEVERVPVTDWYPNGRLDLTVGLRRSERMVLEHGPFWGCAAFIDRCRRAPCAGRRPHPRLGLGYHGSHGGEHCAVFALEHHVPVRAYPIPRV
jgi:hypothetical protein